MSEVQARPSVPRGRGSARGGRGGYGSRGRGGRPAPANGDIRDTAQSDSAEDQGELGEMKKQYSSELSTLKELFPDWTDVDLLFALQETNGDLQSTIERISEGHVSQFSDVKNKTKDRSRSKADNRGAALVAAATDRPHRSVRGRDSAEASRGGRGRPERGRGAFRGSRGSAQTATNEARSAAAPTSVPTTESSAWDTSATPADNNENASWDTPTASAGISSAVPATVSESQKSSVIQESSTRKGGWAGLFAMPKPAPALPKSIIETAPPLAEIGLPPPDTGFTAQEEVPQGIPQGEALPIPPVAHEISVQEPEPDASMRPKTPDDVRDEPALDITPSKDALTEDNVEHLPDVSHPPPTETAASTVANAADIGVATPAAEIPQPPIGRPPMGGFATSAYKATGAPGRSASFQRRVLEQQEAVVMPGNHAVDRAAVQFGRMGLDGDADSLDVDDEREEAETRTQPPQHSPPAQPRASLPPATRQPSLPDETAIPEALPTPKQAPGLPPAPQQQQPLMQRQESPSASAPSQIMSQQGSQSGQTYSQFGRYGQPSMQPEPSAPAQKPYDPFGQQAPQSSQFEGYPGQAQPHNQQQQSSQSHVGGFSSAPNDYSSYYTSDHQRNAYQNYYGNAYGQQGNSTQQDAGASQQRSGSAFQGVPGESAFPSSQSQQAQSRYGEVHNSGHNTPNPVLGGQHPSAAQSQQAQHMPQQQHHGQTQHGGGFPGYGGHAYYNTPYYQYMNQYGGYGQQGFGGPFGGKGGMYGQPHHGYGMPPSSYDQHSSSPANVSGFGQSSLHGRDSGLSSGLGEYGRSGSTQPSQTQQHTSSGGSFGGMPDVFGRSQSGYPGQSQPYGQQPSGPQPGSDDSLKPFGDKGNAGPSPSALGQPGRPGSATSNLPGQGGQSGLPPPQSHQQGFGGYPSHLGQVPSGQGSQYGGLGGLGGHQGGAQSHQSGGYSGFGGGYGGSYSSYGRGGWGSNYGH